MTECEKLKACPFFNDRMANIPATARMFKKRYCLDNFAACARLQVSEAIGGDNVPRDLFPNQRNRVESIISNFR